MKKGHYWLQLHSMAVLRLLVCWLISPPLLCCLLLPSRRLAAQPSWSQKFSHSHPMPAPALIGLRASACEELRSAALTDSMLSRSPP